MERVDIVGKYDLSFATIQQHETYGLVRGRRDARSYVRISSSLALVWTWTSSFEFAVRVSCCMYLFCWRFLLHFREFCLQTKAYILAISAANIGRIICHTSRPRAVVLRKGKCDSKSSPDFVNVGWRWPNLCDGLFLGNVSAVSILRCYRSSGA